MLGQERVVDPFAVPGSIVIPFSVADKVEDRRHSECTPTPAYLALGCQSIVKLVEWILEHAYLNYFIVSSAILLSSYCQSMRGRQADCSQPLVGFCKNS